MGWWQNYRIVGAVLFICVGHMSIEYVKSNGSSYVLYYGLVVACYS